jgi:hypothetical protein
LVEAGNNLNSFNYNGTQTSYHIDFQNFNSGGNILWQTQLPSDTSLELGGNLKVIPSFVDDKFVKVEPDNTNSLYERLSTHKMNGAELHPLLKKVIDEANSLERQNRELSNKAVEVSKINSNLHQQSNATIDSLLKQRSELEGKLTSKEHIIEEMQITHKELQQAHDDLRVVLKDYSEESVNEIVDDYQTQITYYERIIRSYENDDLDKMSFSEEQLYTQLKETQDRLDRAHSIIHEMTSKLDEKDDTNNPLLYTQDALDFFVDKAKIDLIEKQEASISHEEKFMELGPGIPVWQASTGRGPFLTQVLKPFTHKDKDKTKSFGWIVRSEAGKEEHFPIGDLTTEKPVRVGPSKLKLALISSLNAIAFSLVSVQALGAKAILPVAIAQVIVAGLTYREFSKK